ncbi:LrgB family protein [Agathobaculum sp. TL06]
MIALLSSAPFWTCVSIACYAFGQKIQRRTGSALCNPLLIASVLVGVLLVCTGTSYETYNQSGRLISFFLTPATVALAVPIYRKLDVLRQNLFPILAGALVGSVVSIASVILFSRLFGLSDTTMRSLIPKSVTTPIAVSLSEMLGGLAPVTTIAVVFTGIIGAMLLPVFLKCIGVRNEVQMGLSIGTAAHAVGTSRAIELGETEGAMSGLAIGIAGLLTALIVSVGSLLLSI